jgi:hypothetical protein
MSDSTFIRTGVRELDELVPRILGFLEKDSLDMTIDGVSVRGYRSPDSRALWIRDHSDILRGAKYIEEDVQSAVSHFAETQAANGRIFDYVTTFPDKLPTEKENWTKYVRVPVEADVEYRFVKAAYLGWQAGGDDDWIQRMIPHLEKALDYVRNSPWRWEKKLGLVKRAYTIDTWDFAYSAGRNSWLEFQITDDTFWGIMHGDNSGYFEAFRLMARIYRYFEESEKELEWRTRAQDIKERMNRVCWNGRFYTHFVKQTPVKIAGVDEASQLSLSNPMAVNRWAASHQQAVSIIKEYQHRSVKSKSFAPWFSIDPPFPDGVFGEEKLVPGSYVNGGIMPLVGGELARASFEHGFERYGVDILKQYHDLISENNETYLWYFPDGTPSSVDTSTSPEATPADGWGSSAMLYALIEGLAGVLDCLKTFKKVRFSPRWPAADVTNAEVRLTYASSAVSFWYTIHYSVECILIRVEAPSSTMQCHIMLPPHAHVFSVKDNENLVPFSLAKVGKSLYVDFDLFHVRKSVIRIIL